MGIKKLSGTALVERLKRNHKNVFNEYETKHWIEMLEDNNDIEAVLSCIDELQQEFEALADELEMHQIREDTDDQNRETVRRQLRYDL